MGQIVDTRRTEAGLIFAGEYEHRIDAQGRLSIPSRFRIVFEKGIVLSQALDRCVTVYTPDEFAQIAGEIGRHPTTSADARRLARSAFSRTYELELDSHGRVLIPPALREYAGLKEDAVIVGVGRFAEIWATEAWKVERASLDREAASIAERMTPRTSRSGGQEGAG